ncbi:MAG: hypothetical protein IPN61_00025 [Bacteroidetes bacterium]|nr:hypothetical protein [Bacteroidota bacterium]
MKNIILHEPLTRVWQKWRFYAPQTHLWLIKVWFYASTFVVKIATFAKLNENDFPNELKEDWNWIIKNMTKEEPRYLSNGKMLFSSIENTMKSIHNSTGSKIAERIFNLYINLQDSNK